MGGPVTFFRGSRYERVGEAELTRPDGRIVRYKQTRFIPPTPSYAEHVVRDGDRLDLLAAVVLGDPERFWLICDANRATWPAEIVSRTGDVIGIPLDEPRR
jgi:nucleoid-associated protein YgaU